MITYCDRGGWRNLHIAENIIIILLADAKWGVGIIIFLERQVAFIPVGPGLNNIAMKVGCSCHVITSSRVGFPRTPAISVAQTCSAEVINTMPLKNPAAESLPVVKYTGLRTPSHSERPANPI